MDNQKQQKRKKEHSRVFCENPYDLETLFESLSLASAHDKELIFVDRLLSYIRLDPTAEITDISFKILRELEIVKLEM